MACATRLRCGAAFARQYSNRYQNVEPLVPRYLRLPVRGRLDRKGQDRPLELDDVRAAIGVPREKSRPWRSVS
jgi:hypothetical protein